MRSGALILVILMLGGISDPDASAQVRDTADVIRHDARPQVTARAQGGVRIQSFRGRRFPARVLQPSYTPSASRQITEDDLRRLENRIIARLGAMLAGTETGDGFTSPFPFAGPGSYFVLYPPDGAGVPDTVFIHTDPDDPMPPATRLTPPRIPDASLLEAPRAEIASLVEQIEREIFDRGLFSAISVQFEFGKSRLMEGAQDVLDAVGEVLRRHPELQIVVEGHTDSIGPRNVNMRLSEERARSVKEFILNRFPDVDGRRMTPVGRGFDEPVASNETETGRALNRRVVFRVEEPPPAAHGIPAAYREPARISARPAHLLAPGEM